MKSAHPLFRNCWKKNLRQYRCREKRAVPLQNSPLSRSPTLPLTQNSLKGIPTTRFISFRKGWKNWGIWIRSMTGILESTRPAASKNSKKPTVWKKLVSQMQKHSGHCSPRKPRQKEMLPVPPTRPVLPRHPPPPKDRRRPDGLDFASLPPSVEGGFLLEQFECQCGFLRN